uniref:Uncharacterized protein n=1 Tax=Rhizophora mucronata TaxID=61149 RepID=A0A2P2PFJ4_RHIMU
MISHGKPSALKSFSKLKNLSRILKNFYYVILVVT